MTELFLGAIGLISICCFLIVVNYWLFTRITTGLWPSEIQKAQMHQEAKASYDIALARSERDLISRLNGKIAENEYLRSRIKDLEKDIDNLRDAKDTAEDAFITFLTSLK